MIFKMRNRNNNNNDNDMLNYCYYCCFLTVPCSKNLSKLIPVTAAKTLRDPNDPFFLINYVNMFLYLQRRTIFVVSNER